MKDEDIRKTVLSDWIPEQDIKLQKAFGKFVEEVGELFVAFESFDRYLVSTHKSVEDELADCSATIEMIDLAGGRFTGARLIDRDRLQRLELATKGEDGIKALLYEAGKVLTIIGRCQIQGLDKSDPTSRRPNRETLSEALFYFKHAVNFFSEGAGLNLERMYHRYGAKVETKLPWVMGTATDLIPDV